MDSFTPVAALIGGLLIGISSVLLLVFNGRIAGISGITGQLLHPRAGDMGWRLTFLAGLMGGGAALFALWPAAFDLGVDRSLPAVAVAGLLVGFGTRTGSGCTSGHGICGIARLSPRSVVATLVFMFTGAATVFVVNHFFGGAL